MYVCELILMFPTLIYYHMDVSSLLPLIICNQPPNSTVRNLVLPIYHAVIF